MRLVFDLEADDLYPDVSRVWCIVAKDIDSGTMFKEVVKPWNSTVLDNATMLIGHNIINYDLPTLKKCYGWTTPPKCKIFDTLVVSRMLFPDRLGGHSLDAWGKRFKRYKPGHDDWSQFSTAMLHRCTEDVEINVLTYLQLIKEMKG